MASDKRKILYITATRAEYGLMSSTLKAIDNHPKLELELVVTGTHLSGKFGLTIEEILKDNFKIHEVKIPEVKDNLTMAKSFGEAVIRLSEAIREINPCIVLIEADRYEGLAGAVAGAFLNIPVAHVSGGDVSGSIDESIRHSITKFAHLHFPGTEKSAQRIIKMGEKEKYVFMVGTPGLEDIEKDSKEIAEKFNLNLEKPIILVLQHPVTTESDKAGTQMAETMAAVSKLKEQAIVIYPNNDPGSEEMIKEIEKYRDDNLKIYKNISRHNFLALMKAATVMVGNSSAGIVEAPKFNLPVVNIGSRQENRERAGNIYDVEHNGQKIYSTVKEIISRGEKPKIESPYSGDETPNKIANILAEIEITPELLQKRLTY